MFCFDCTAMGITKPLILCQIGSFLGRSLNFYLCEHCVEERYENDFQPCVETVLAFEVEA